MAKRGRPYPAFMKKVRDTVNHYDMLEAGDKVLAAVSGGPDSVCLLMSLLSMKKLGLDVVVGNLDHGIRKRGSKADSEFVKKLSKELGLKCAHKRLDLKSYKGKLSMEEKARQERYAFLTDAARKNGCGIIATGHTLDDQAETMVMRFMAGTSFKGLSGIPPVRYENGIKVIRPLIRVKKKEILDLAKAEGWQYREDHTNRDTKYFRNSVRAEVLPFLEKYNPKIRRSLANLADSVREDSTYLEEIRRGAVSCLKGGARISAKDMILQPRALRKSIFKELFTRAGGDVKKLTYRHWMDMDRFLSSGGRKGSLNFPGIKMSRERGDIIFTSRKEQK